jgi:hypothetical protein
MSYCQTLIDELIKHTEECKIIPMEFCPRRFFTFTFEGWKITEVSIHDNELQSAINVASSTMKTFYEVNKYTWAFSKPIFILKNNGSCEVKIGIMDLKDYEEIYEKYS